MVERGLSKAEEARRRAIVYGMDGATYARAQAAYEQQAADGAPPPYARAWFMAGWKLCHDSRALAVQEEGNG